MTGHMAWFKAQAKTFLATGRELIWPSRSLVSNRRETGAPGLAPDEWVTLDFITAPICDICGIPVPLDLGESEGCAACASHRPIWRRARAALVYDDVSRKLIFGLKRAGRRDGLSTMANWMALSASPLLKTADCIVPVPLHYRRLASRGFNQSAWLAQAIAKSQNCPLCVDALKRVRPTRSQAGLSARARQRNLHAAIAVRRGRRHLVQNQGIVLIDDVLTTGATVSACARALLQSGARHVDVITLARVVRPRDVSI